MKAGRGLVGTHAAGFYNPSISMNSLEIQRTMEKVQQTYKSRSTIDEVTVVIFVKWGAFHNTTIAMARNIGPIHLLF